jgi:hypothetical protein
MKRHLVQSTGSLVPLHMAARIVYAAVYQPHKSAASHERLGGLAQAIVALIPIYTIPRGETQPRRIPEPQLTGGVIRLGGKEVRFTDGRPAITGVLVTRTGIDHVIKLLSAAPDEEEIPVEPEAPIKGLGSAF